MNVAQILHGDCRELLSTLPADTFDSCVTDPPYELGFMGKSWDSRGVAFDLATWAHVLRVLKPGAYMLAFGGTRTYHRIACAIEDAGFEIRDCIMWVYGSGFPKSHNGEWGGTALKPAYEPIIVARKAPIGTIEKNWQTHGVGGLRIDDCRVPMGADEDLEKLAARSGGERGFRKDGYVGGAIDGGLPAGWDVSKGRYPANLIHDGSDEVLGAFPNAPGQLAPENFTAPSSKTRNTYGARGRRPGGFGNVGADDPLSAPNGPMYSDKGSAARFFYCAKASRTDRNEGCEHIERKPLNWSSGTQSPGTFQAEGTDRTSSNNHPTVKPTDLMRYLCRLVTPVGGMVLDPFSGSGSTAKAAMLESLNLVGCELDAAYIAIAQARIRAVGGMAL